MKKNSATVDTNFVTVIELCHCHLFCLNFKLSLAIHVMTFFLHEKNLLIFLNWKRYPVLPRLSHRFRPIRDIERPYK